MKECCEKSVEVGFSRDPKAVFDEVEAVSADMIRKGWSVENSFIEDGLGNIHIVFVRDFKENL